MSLFGTQLILVDDVEKVGRFLKSFLDEGSILVRDSPKSRVSYGILLSRSVCVVLVKRGDCNANVLAAFGTVSVTRLFVDASDTTKAKAAIQDAGNLRVFEDTSEDRVGDVNQPDMIVVEGPEKIVLHIVVLSSSSSTGGGGGGGGGSPDTEDEAQARLIARCDFMVESFIAVAEKSSLSPSDGAGAKGGSLYNRKSVRQPIPTLDVQILSDNSQNFVSMPPNAKGQPFPFETEFFKGTAFLTVLHSTMDPQFKPFYPADKKREFEVQVQGRFKRLPEGEIFVGAESTSKMEMGWMTRSFSNMALKFAGTMVNDLHYSFGEDQKQALYEFPHVVAPMFPTLDKILETKDGETLPEMGVPFKEDQDYRKKRLKWTKIKDANIDLETTYSFSVNTSNISLPSWEMCNIPMCNPVPLSDFIGDSAVRLVAYEISQDIVDGHKTHPQQHTNYVFNIVLNSVDPSKAQEIDQTVGIGMEITSDDEIDVVVDDRAGAGGGSGPAGVLGAGSSSSSSSALNRGEKRASKPKDAPLGAELRSQIQSQRHKKSGGGGGSFDSTNTGSSTNFYSSDSAEEDEDDDEEDEDEGYDDSMVVGSEDNDISREEYEEDDEVESGGRKPAKAAHRFRIPSVDEARERTLSLRDSIGNKLLRGRGGGKGGDDSDPPPGGGSGSGGSHYPPNGDIAGHSYPPGGGSGSGIGSNLKDWMTGITNSIPAVNDVAEGTGDYMVPSYALETEHSERYCPMIIEMADSSRIIKNRANTFLYLLPYLPKDGSASSKAAAASSRNAYLVRLRSYDEVSKVFKMLPIPKLYKNRSAVAAEKRRRQIVLSYQATAEKAATPPGSGNEVKQLVELLHAESAIDKSFLGSNSGTSSSSSSSTGGGGGEHGEKESRFNLVKAAMRRGMERSGSITQGGSNSSTSTSSSTGDAVSGPPDSPGTRAGTKHELESMGISSGGGAGAEEVVWAATAALAMSSRHWIQFLVSVTNEEVQFRQTPTRKPTRIPLETILSAGLMADDDAPCRLHGYSFVYIETLHKFHYLMLRAEATTSFLDTMGTLCIPAVRALGAAASSSYSSADQLEEKFNQTLLLRHKMDIFKLGRKNLYNCRRILFRPSAAAKDACGLAASLLERALRLSDLWGQRSARRTTPIASNSDNSGSSGGDDGPVAVVELWLQFLDSVCDLQVVEVTGMSETSRAAMFLNIYHTMVVHGSLVLFPPQTSANWQPFFNEVAYLLSFDVISMAELEHNVIKASMTKPPRLAMGLGRHSSAPKSAFPGFALAKRDFRYVFCVNNGSLSMPGKICVYTPATLDTQLDEMVGLVVSETISVDEFKRVVTMPVVCNWHALDFVPRGASPSHIDTLRTLALYVLCSVVFPFFSCL
jgi:hypothetical protein